MARRSLFKRQEFKLDGDWVGWNFTAIVNLPLKVLEDYAVKEANIAVMRELLGSALTDWDFTDDDGNPYPSPSAEVLRELPHDLVTAMFTLYTKEVLTLPQA